MLLLQSHMMFGYLAYECLHRYVLLCLRDLLKCVGYLSIFSGLPGPYDFPVSGLQKGPAERGHVKKRQKSSTSVKKLFETFRQFSRRAKNVKNRQKVSKSFSTLFDNFRVAPFFRPLLGGSDPGKISKIIHTNYFPGTWYWYTNFSSLSTVRRSDPHSGGVRKERDF